MKKILLAIAFVMMISFGANAQRDGFFSTWDNNDRDLNSSDIHLPSEHYNNTNNPAPLGSGLLVLTAFGAGYVIRKKTK